MIVWAGVNSHGKTQVYFIEYRATISNNDYIEYIIEPLIRYDISHLFPDDIQKKMVLHQDSAPGHIAKDTMSLMKEHNINVKCGMHGHLRIPMLHQWIIQYGVL